MPKKSYDQLRDALLTAIFAVQEGNATTIHVTLRAVFDEAAKCGFINPDHSLRRADWYEVLLQSRQHGPGH